MSSHPALAVLLSFPFKYCIMNAPVCAIWLVFIAAYKFASFKNCWFPWKNFWIFTSLKSVPVCFTLCIYDCIDLNHFVLDDDDNNKAQRLIIMIDGALIIWLLSSCVVRLMAASGGLCLRWWGRFSDIRSCVTNICWSSSGCSAFRSPSTCSVFCLNRDMFVKGIKIKSLGVPTEKYLTLRKT